MSKDVQLLTPGLSETVNSIVFEIIISVQDSLDQTLARKYAGAYPWDEKASTSAKCLQAWLKFDEQLDMPVYEVIESLEWQSRQAAQYASGKTSLAVLEQLKRDNDQLLEDRRLSQLESVQQRGTTEKAVRVRRYLVIIVAILIYAISLLTYGVARGGASELVRVLDRAFIDSWPVTSIVVTLTVAILAVPSDRIAKWRRSNASNHAAD